jgi:hypothetical protein
LCGCGTSGLALAHALSKVSALAFKSGLWVKCCLSVGTLGAATTDAATSVAITRYVLRDFLLPSIIIVLTRLTPSKRRNAENVCIGYESGQIMIFDTVAGKVSQRNPLFFVFSLVTVLFHWTQMRSLVAAHTSECRSLDLTPDDAWLLSR